ncbi:hypothetical protein AA0474_3268 [Acetobacter lovaniensis NRIC 0474]|nr:hypothetical protein AA0474_3268 [Acetobacter lovaniensis NRIC 0474]
MSFDENIKPALSALTHNTKCNCSVRLRTHSQNMDL